jgi:Fe-S cluster biosynthesis and repair protein YggX
MANFIQPNMEFLPNIEDKKEDRKEDDEELFDVNIFRYKFSDNFTKPLYQFSKIHQYDHRKDFKEAWNNWIEENTDLINTEVKRLTELDYKGDILDKMFKSARYYFRKKSTEKKVPQKRRSYVGIQSELLEAMDKHINANKKNENYKPSSGFDEFCKQYIEILKVEVVNLCKSGLKDSEEIKNKIKKTYKNRYFMSISKLP